jgi:DNA modification methylase
MNTIEFGDCRETMRRWKEQGIKAQTCVTSPPYYGLRDYGHEGQIGLEETPEEYIKAMVEVFRCVWDVLEDDGTLWLNIGDSYFNHPSSAVNRNGMSGSLNDGKSEFDCRIGTRGSQKRKAISDGCKPKDLIGIPWMLAFALRADGWYLRQDIIWHKPNPMPESVQDRCTKSHEYIFLMSKSQKYYYDAEAIKEASSDPEGSANRYKAPFFAGEKHESGGYSATGPNHTKGMKEFDGNRNKRSVWTVTTKPYAGAHFAVFPSDLIEPCILAGSRTAGKRCDCNEVISTPTGTGEINDPSIDVGRAGMARPRRMGEGTRPITRLEQRHHASQIKASAHRDEMAAICGPAFDHYIRTDSSGARPLPEHHRSQFMANGWITSPEPCDCPSQPADIVLDPFMGSGTTAQVAQDLGRQYLGCELNPEYKKLQDQRLAQQSLIFED